MFQVRQEFLANAGTDNRRRREVLRPQTHSTRAKGSEKEDAEIEDRPKQAAVVISSQFSTVNSMFHREHPWTLPAKPNLKRTPTPTN
jgi:hypothetical protein